MPSAGVWRPKGSCALSETGGANVPQMSKPIAEGQWSEPTRGWLVSGWRCWRENAVRASPITTTDTRNVGKIHEVWPRLVRPPPVRATLVTFRVVVLAMTDPRYCTGSRRQAQQYLTSVG